MPLAVLNKSILKISGDNAKSLLDGLMTQDINKISQNTPIYSLFLNTRGQVLFITIIYMLDENSLALEIEPELLMELAKHIHKHDLSKTVEFSQIDDSFIAISNNKEQGLLADPRSAQMPYRGIIKNKINSNSQLLEDYENTRLKLTIPENHDFIKEKSLVNDLNTEDLNGVSFTKGCYLGQEITSKTKHIKKTKNQLVSINNSNYKLTQSNLEIFNQDAKKIGQTFSYNSKFVLAIIKRGSENLENLKFKQKA